jgi:hypothetical protein
MRTIGQLHSCYVMEYPLALPNGRLSSNFKVTSRYMVLPLLALGVSAPFVIWRNIDHLFFRCSFVESSLGALLCNADTLTRRAVGSNLECLECLEDVLAWVYAVETLQKSRR